MAEAAGPDFGGLAQGAANIGTFFANQFFADKAASRANEVSKNQRRYFAIREYQLKRKSLERAGFNPILAVGGSAPSSASAVAAQVQRLEAPNFASFEQADAARAQSSSAAENAESTRMVASQQAELLRRQQATETAREIAENHRGTLLKNQSDLAAKDAAKAAIEKDLYEEANSAYKAARSRAGVAGKTADELLDRLFDWFQGSFGNSAQREAYRRSQGGGN